MPLDQFIEEAYNGLAAGKEQVPVGTSKQSFDTWEAERQKQFHGMVEAISRRNGRNAEGAQVKQH